MPGADRGEGFQNTNLQLFSEYDVTPDAVPTNKGFVINFKASIAADQAKHCCEDERSLAPAAARRALVRFKL